MVLSVFVEHLRTVIRRRRTLRELAVLSDRDLSDIGIVRTEIRG
jgi:uncharacterized protein YjiS (DUF1127 family)